MATERFRISTQILVHIVDQVEKRGFDADSLLTHCRLSRRDLTDVERMAPLDEYVRFFELAAQTLQDPHFGLHAAQGGDLGALGALSFLFMSAPTLREAFNSFTQFLNVIQEGTRIDITSAPEGVRFAYQLTDSRITPRRQDAEYSIAAMYQLINAYMAGAFTPIEVYFEHDRIGAYETYAHYFRCEVFFGQATNAILFDKTILAARSPRLSTRLYGLISAQLNSAMQERGKSLSMTDRVNQELSEDRIAKGVTIHDVASLLNYSTSALSRRLADEGVSFRDLLVARRIALAERLLQESEQPINDIALRVGYSEAASFSRAFKRTTGDTAERFRLNARRLRHQNL